MKIVYFLGIFLFTTLFSRGQIKDYKAFIETPKVSTNSDSLCLPERDLYHPHLFESLSRAERDSFRTLIAERKKKFPGDSLPVTDMFRIYKPLIDRLNFEDPHYRIYLFPQLKDKHFTDKNIRVLPLRFLVIGDTVLVDKTLDTIFHRGDRILSVNGTPIGEFLSCSYNDRYIESPLMQQNYHFFFYPHYVVDIERNNRRIRIETEGQSYKQTSFRLRKDDFGEKIYSDSRTAYFQISRFFPLNSRLIRKLAKFMQHARKEGCKNLIIDVRYNPGGSGSDFDELISLFCGKDSIPYQRGQKLRVSKAVLSDYDFLTQDSLGKLVNMPDKYVFHHIPLQPKKYRPGLKVYVLMSRNTGSQASTFVNILQYNDMALLVGEPLAHNAYKYGEVIYREWLHNASSHTSSIAMYSVIEMDEYTKARDGVIVPDIPIPYSASEYMQGGDPLLEKLLQQLQ